MKTCTQCNIEKNEEDFRWRNKNKGLRAPWCKPCFSDYERAKWKSSPERRKGNTDKGTLRRHRNRQYIWDYLKTHPCACGENDPVVLEFDHRDPKTKTGNVSEMAGQILSIAKLTEEIKKCDVLCANCHRRKTAIQFEWYKEITK